MYSVFARLTECGRIPHAGDAGTAGTHGVGGRNSSALRNARESQIQGPEEFASGIVPARFGPGVRAGTILCWRIPGPGPWRELHQPAKAGFVLADPHFNGGSGWPR